MCFRILYLFVPARRETTTAEVQSKQALYALGGALTITVARITPLCCPYLTPTMQEKSYMFEERLEAAGRLRELGNERFKRGRMENAAEAYQR